jgi:hypothetical protein
MTRLRAENPDENRSGPDTIAQTGGDGGDPACHAPAGD